MKTAKLIHRCLVILLWAALAGMFIAYFIAMPGLPDEPGIHFSPDREFDVYASKIYGFYPHLITLIILLVDLGGTWAVTGGKLKLGLNVTERGNELIKWVIALTLDLAAAFFEGYFVFWTYSVCTQRPLSSHAPGCAMHTYEAGFLGLIVCVILSRKYALPKTEESREKKLALDHRIHRLLGWIGVGMVFLIVLFVMERLPEGDLADEHHGMAWFANFGEYLPKWLVLSPFMVLVPLMGIFELLGDRAFKAGDRAGTQLADGDKSTLAIFCIWWALMLASEEPIGWISTCLCAGALWWDLAEYLFRRKKGSSKEQSPDSDF